MEVLEGERKKWKGKSPYSYAVTGSLMLTVAYVIFGDGFALRTADQKAYVSYDTGEFEAAEEQFSDPMWRGVSAFRQGEFKKAAAVFSGIQSAEGFYNRGNSFVMLGKYANAIECYEKSLALVPSADAELNLKIAQARLEALTFDGGNMTDGKLAGNTNDIVFDKGKGDQEQADEVEVEGAEMDDVQMREVWLRKVQTKPADFLKSKFMYQRAVESQEGAQND